MKGFGDEGKAGHALEVAGVVGDQRQLVTERGGGNPGIGKGHGLPSHRAAREFRPGPGQLLVERQNDEAAMNEALQREPPWFCPILSIRPAINFRQGHEGDIALNPQQMPLIGGSSRITFVDVADDVGVQQHGWLSTWGLLGVPLIQGFVEALPFFSRSVAIQILRTLDDGDTLQGRVLLGRKVVPEVLCILGIHKGWCIRIVARAIRHGAHTAADPIAQGACGIIRRWRAEHGHYLAVVTQDFDDGVTIFDGFDLIEAMRREVAKGQLSSAHAVMVTGGQKCVNALQSTRKG